MILRLITVLEHEVVQVVEGTELPASGAWLSEGDSRALLRLSELRPGFCQRVAGGVKLAQYCGIVRLPTCLLEILPKVGISEARSADELDRSRAALLTMLRNARSVALTKVGVVPQRVVRVSLLDVFIEAFLQCALAQARRGVLSRYVFHSDDLPVIKGRFRAIDHLRRNFGKPHLLYCEYDEFTADNPYNRAITAALDVCRNWISRGDIQRLWFETQARFANVSLVRMSAVDVSRLPRDRTTRRYEPVLTWCERMLAMCSPALSAGKADAPALLFDMNKLFEDHVASIEEAAVGMTRVVQRQGPKEPLAAHGEWDAFTLKPDITVWHTSLTGARLAIDRVVDSKWKRLDPAGPCWGVDQADVYQVLAYAVHYHCRRVELVYPLSESLTNAGEPPTFRIATLSGANTEYVTVAVRLVDVWQRESIKVEVAQTDSELATTLASTNA